MQLFLRLCLLAGVMCVLCGLMWLPGIGLLVNLMGGIAVYFDTKQRGYSTTNVFWSTLAVVLVFPIFGAIYIVDRFDDAHKSILFN